MSPVSFDGTTYTLRVSYGCVVVPTYYQLVMHTKSGNYDVINMEDALPYVEGEIASFTLQVSSARREKWKWQGERRGVRRKRGDLY